MANESQPDYDEVSDQGELRIKIICLGDSAVGKSKLMERFLMEEYKPQQLSTYALTLYRHKMQIDGQPVLVDFWDTAGQERFSNLHPSYYHQAHACIMVFDGTRKVTYKNLPKWLGELREFRPEIPCLCAVNKIDADESLTKRAFNFASKNRMAMYYVSASTGTNVVKLFNDAIRVGMAYKSNSTDFMDEIMKELENIELDGTLDNVSHSSKESAANSEHEDRKTDLNPRAS